jgi:CBS domain-containing protein
MQVAAADEAETSEEGSDHDAEPGSGCNDVQRGCRGSDRRVQGDRRCYVAPAVSAFPLIDADNEVIGVISEADLPPREVYPPASYVTTQAASSGSAKAEALTAAELMTSPAITITPDASVAEASRVMYSSRVKRLPVVNEDGRLVGIVSRVDLLRLYDRPDAGRGQPALGGPGRVRRGRRAGQTDLPGETLSGWSARRRLAR